MLHTSVAQLIQETDIPMRIKYIYTHGVLTSTLTFRLIITYVPRAIVMRI